jgi:hypothetical protein
LILDNHSAHISTANEESANNPSVPPIIDPMITHTLKLEQINEGFDLITFTPKHGSWLNLIEGF